VGLVFGPISTALSGLDPEPHGHSVQVAGVHVEMAGRLLDRAAR